MSEEKTTKKTHLQIVRASLVAALRVIFNTTKEAHQQGTAGVVGVVSAVGPSLAARASSPERKMADAVVSHLQAVQGSYESLAKFVSPKINNAVELVDQLIEATHAESAATIEGLNSLLQEVTEATGKRELVIPRPASDFLQDTSVNDVFHCTNDPESVRTRLRFLHSREGVAVGACAILSESDEDRPVMNIVNFADHINCCDRVHGRRLDVDNSNDGVFVYRSAVQLAVSFADAMVTLYGPLVSVLSERFPEELPLPDESLSDVDRADPDSVPASLSTGDAGDGEEIMDDPAETREAVAVGAGTDTDAQEELLVSDNDDTLDLDDLGYLPASAHTEVSDHGIADADLDRAVEEALAGLPDEAPAEPTASAVGAGDGLDGLGAAEALFDDFADVPEAATEAATDVVDTTSSENTAAADVPATDTELAAVEGLPEGTADDPDAPVTVDPDASGDPDDGDIAAFLGADEVSNSGDSLPPAAV